MDYNPNFGMTMENTLLQGANATLGEAVMNLNDTHASGGEGGSAPVQTTPLYIYITVSVFYGLIFLLGIVGKCTII